VDDDTFVYSIDSDDTVASVSDAWLEFARRNRAGELTREYVLSQSLWRFIDGRETRQLYETLFDRVRTGHEPIELPFRCDSPDRFRFMRLVLRPAPQDSIRCEAHLLREQQRPVVPILDRAFPRSKSRLPICSLCKRVFAFGARWLELEDAIGELDLFESAKLPELDHVVCGDCASAVEVPELHRAGNDSPDP
jgi:hypothetical protein